MSDHIKSPLSVGFFGRLFSKNVTISTMAKLVTAQPTDNPPKSRSRLLIIAIVLVACLALAGIVIIQATKSQEVRQYYSVSAWSDEAAQTFFDNCTYVASRPGNGVSEESAKVYCGCSTDALQSIYKSDDELADAEKAWVENGFSNTVNSAMRECAETAQIPFNA